MNILAPIDRFLNRITMYRLVLYYLIALVGIATVFGAIGWLPYNPIAIVFSAVFLWVVAWIANGIFAHLFKAQQNSESMYITALILALIITPGMPLETSAVVFFLWAAVWAMASKYILAAHKKHLFNPAAIAVVITAYTMNDWASWWVGGNLPLMAFVIIGGLLVIRKIRRFDLALSFFVAALASSVLTQPGYDPISVIQKALLHTPIFFFASIMITEPLTTPPTRGRRIAYGALVGALFAPAMHIGSIYSTPELALVVGNIFSYAMSPKRKMVLTLKETQEVGTDLYNFIFTPDEGKSFTFRPGQYLEWTLSHPSADGRGNRRYFTIASSPTEREIHLGVRFYDPPSSFKSALKAMRRGDTIIAGQLAGDFTLPRDPRKKLAFIAGGIGITPFRSMMKFLLDTRDRRDVIMLYSNRTPEEVAYRKLFDETERVLGIKTLYTFTGTPPVHRKKGKRDTARNDAIRTARIDREFITQEIPDYHERMFYISGTYAMTSALQATLLNLGVPRSHIKIDFFPGFA